MNRICTYSGLLCCIFVQALMPSADLAYGEAVGSVAIENVRIFDGERVIPRGTVVWSQGKIDGAGPDIPPPAGAEVIDGAGKTLLPGLIDAHVHIWSPQGLQQSLVFGVTTVLDMFMQPAVMAEIERQRASGQVSMSSLLSAGILVTAPEGHGTEYGVIPTLTSADEAQAFVDARIAEGSDYIKIVYDDGSNYGLRFNTLDRQTLEAVVKAAHRRGKRAVVHTGSLGEARAALEAGADGLAHLPIDGTVDAEFGRQATAAGLFVISTLCVLETARGTSGAAILVQDAHLSPYLMPMNIANLHRPLPFRYILGAAGYESAARLARQLRDAAGILLAGTDAPAAGTTYGASLHRELELLVEAGPSPVEALGAATARPAAAFGLTDRGRIQPGRRADLVLVDGDPTEDIEATRAIVGIWQEGVSVDRTAYRRAVESERETAEKQRHASPPGGAETGLVSDFEAEELTTAFGTGWSLSTDEFMGGKSTAEFARTAPGAGDSAGALSISGTIAQSSPAWAGALFSPGPAIMAPANLSAKKTIRFQARGDGKTCFIMLFAESMGFMPAIQTFTTGPKWREHTFSFSQFGTDAHDLTGVFFGGGTEPGTFNFQIDDVHFD